MYINKIIFESKLKAGPRRFKQLRKNLKMKPLSPTNILYLILYASVILNVGIFSR